MKSAFMTLLIMSFGIFFSILPKPLSGDEEDEDVYFY